MYSYFTFQLTTHTAPVDLSSPRSLISRALLLLLLLTGFAAMSILGQGQRAPLSAMGLPRRPGAGGEFTLGAALGWAAAVALVLPVAAVGGLIVTVNSHGAEAARGLVLSLAGVLLSALLGELLFRGYAFQRLIEACGPTLATLLMLLPAAFLRSGGYPRSAGSLLAAVLLNLLLAVAYLRTRALWVGIGLHFAWGASLAVLFGLPVDGFAAGSAVLSTYTNGPAWLAGAGAGPEGSAVAVAVLLIMLFVAARVTRELRHRWALPEIVGAGIPVDLDAAARKQHERAMGEASSAPAPLVQIAPAAPAPPKPLD